MEKAVNGKGTYVLILYLRKGARLRIGKLGCFEFKRGYYAYVGSAFGPGGLAARLKHHRAIAKKPHWHIDYLRRTAVLQESWINAGQTRKEHDWAQRLLAAKESQCPVKGFGSSDCNCPAHLFYFKRKPVKTFFTRTFPEALRI